MSIVESLTIAGPAGPLEAVLKRPRTGHPRFTAVVCHPLPTHGGTMHNKVVFHLARALEERGAAVMRFNFRGVGASAGSFDDGVGERDDVRAALAALASRYPGLAICLAGFSFGSWVGSAAGCRDARVTQIVAAGTPTRLFTGDALLECPKRKLFVQGGADEFGPVAEIASLVERVPPPKTLAIVEAADHYFTGRLDELRAAVRDYFDVEGDPPSVPTWIVRDRGPSNSHK